MISAQLPSPTTDRAVAGNMAIVTVGNIVTPLFGIVTTPVLAASLGVLGRGELAAATAPLLFGLAIGTFGMPESLTYAIARSRVVQRQGLLLAVLISLLSAGALMVASTYLAPTLAGDDRSIRGLIALSSAFLIPTLEIAVLRGIAAGLHRWRLVAAEQVITATARFAMVCALAAVGHLTPFTATLATIVPLVLGGLAYLPSLRRMPLVTTTESEQSPRAFISYGFRIWLGYLGGIVLLRLDQLVMTPLSSARQLGIYVVAVSFAEVVLVITNSVRDVTFSADAAETSTQRLQASARIATIAAGIFALTLAIITPIVVPTLFGPHFAQSIPVIWTLMLAVVLLTPGSVAGAGLTARGRPGARSAALLAGAVVNVVLLVVLLPRYGALGAAWATVGGNVVFGGLNIVLLCSMDNLRPVDFLVPTAGDVGAIRSLLRAVAARAHRRRADQGPPD